MSKNVKKKNLSISSSFYNDIKSIIIDSRKTAAHNVDFQRVLMYWRLGERIFVEEQHGKDRAEYGDYLISNLSGQLESEFGSGFSYRQLAYCRQFYKVYPIMHALRAQLGEKLPDENPTVGILLCAAKNNTLVKLTLPKENTNILTSKYQFYLPSEEDFLEEIKDVIELAERAPIYE